MQQLDLLSYVPEPAKYQQGDRVLANGKCGEVCLDKGKHVLWVAVRGVAKPFTRSQVTFAPKTCVCEKCRQKAGGAV